MTKGGIHAFGPIAGHASHRQGYPRKRRGGGPVWTPLNPADRDPEGVSKFGGETPMERPAQPEEIAPAFVFLASPNCSSYITARSCRSPMAIQADNGRGAKPMARKAKRKYGRGAGKDVKNEMHRYKRGTAMSGPGGKGGKVKSRKQAIAIGLSKARKEGKAVPRKRAS
jgi:hypothetical protein